MDTVVQILVSGLTLGSMYALATLSRSLVWGSLNMLNMAQGTLLTIGAFASYAASANLGLPIYMGLPLAMLVGWLMGYLMYFGFVRFLVNSPNFDTTVIIATIGLAIILENVVLKIWGAYPLRQPFVLPGDFFVGRINILYQNVLIATVSVAGMFFVAWFVAGTNIGRSDTRHGAEPRGGATDGRSRAQGLCTSSWARRIPRGYLRGVPQHYHHAVADHGA